MAGVKKRATTTKSKTGLRARRKTAGVKTPDTLRTVVVGGDAGYRRAVLRLLKAHPRLAVAGSAGSAVEAEVLLQQCSPQLALIDVRLPDRSGFELVRDVKRKHPDVKIVLIASEDGKEYRAAAALAGADGLMSRDELARQLSAWIRKFLAAPGSRRARGDAQETLVTRSASTGAEKTRNRFRSTFNQAAVGIMHSTTEGWILEANRCLCDMLGYSSNELRTRNTRDLTHPDDRDRQDAQRLELLAGLRSSFSSEKRYVRKDGRVIWVNRTVALGYETPETDPYMIHTIEDITGRKHAVQALQQSQKQYAGLVDSLDSIVWEADAQTFQFTFVSQRAEKLLGYPVKRWLEEPTFWQDHIHPEDRDWAVAYCIAATHELRSHDFEYRMIAADGRAVWLRDIVSVEAENGRPVRSRGVMVDITAGKQAEMDSRRHARARQVLGDCSHTLVHANDEAELLKEMCRIVVESGGYVQAHIGLALKDDRKTIAPVASAGYEAGYLESKQLTWSEDGSSASMTGRVVATGKQYISRDIFIDPHSRHLVERARRRGFRSMIGLPLKIEGTCIGAISIYAREQDAFDDEEVALLATLADDISFGMSSLRARAAHERTETELARVMRARTVLAECSRALVHAVNEADLLREMCRIIVDSGGYQQGWVGLANADPARPVLPVAHAGYQDDAPMAYTGLSPDGRERGVAVTAMTSGETAVARDILNQPGHSWRRERALRNGFQSSIALPLRGDGRVLGVLVMHAPEADAFSDEEIALLTTLVDDIGFGVIKLRADAARREAEARLVRLARARKVMAECSQALVHATDETRLLDGMCRIAVESGGFRQAWIAEVTGDNPLRVRAAAQAGYGGGAPMTGASNWAADGSYQGLAAEAITSGAISIARDILNDPRQARKRHRALELNYQSSIALPLREKGGVIGALVLHAAEKDAFDDEEIALLDGLVADLSYGIANLRMQRARLQAEAAQRESEQRFRNTFEQAAVGITRVDLGGVLVDVNQKFCDMLGYSKDELLGRHVRDITHPDDYGKGAQYRAELSHRAMSSAAGEKRFVRKDGSVLWARRTMSTACDETGKPLYLISVVEDITERKELEQRYRETFDQAAVGIVHSALDGRYIRVNRKFCEMVGYADSELIGQTADLLTHPDDLEQTRRNRRLMADGKADQQTGEKRYIRKDGRVIWVRRTASYARDAAGNPMYIIRVIEDITERKHAESALQRKTELAQLLESLARAANEAATPESAMRTCLERLCEHGNWALGRLGIYGADEQERFPENTLWQSKDPARYEPVMQASVDPKYFSPRGIFITTVRKERRPIWLADIASSPGFGRMRVALDCGLRSAFAFPVIVGDEVAAFLEFFGTEPREADTQLLEAIGSVGAQLARLIERSRALKATLELAAIVESSNDAIIGRSLDGIITSWNAGAERMLGYSAAEAIGQPIGFFLPPGQNVRISEINEKVQHGESITPHDTRRLTSDGRVLVVRSSISPLRNSVGKVIGASQILQDVTALRRAEAVRSRLAAIVDSSSDAIISRGLNGEILTWNPAAERLFGWTAQEAIGRDMRLIVPPERIGENAPYREKVHEGLAVPDYDTWRLTKDGK
ncbi:MAG TPA: PAS domain S-box protein, partial [Burkholderiales bacterium]|nr:PAS domain S-box protein [Burkholderiales bacterium]